MLTVFVNNPQSVLGSNLPYSCQSLIISNTPLDLEWSPFSRPIGKSKPLFFELRTLHRLGQDIGEHVCGSQVFQYNFFLCYFLGQPELTNIDVAWSLRSSTSFLDERHAAHVVLVDHCRTQIMTLRNDMVPNVYGLARGVRQVNKLRLGAGLGTSCRCCPVWCQCLCLRFRYSSNVSRSFWLFDVTIRSSSCRQWISVCGSSWSHWRRIGHKGPQRSR